MMISCEKGLEVISLMNFSFEEDGVIVSAVDVENAVGV